MEPCAAPSLAFAKVLCFPHFCLISLHTQDDEQKDVLCQLYLRFEATLQGPHLSGTWITVNLVITFAQISSQMRR
jgi:hypothetical protein